MDVRSNLALAVCIIALSGPAAFAQTQSGSPSPDPQTAGAKTETKVETEGEGGAADFVEVDEMPRLLKQVPPKYPPGARKRGEQGTVFVRAFVKEDGTTSKITVKDKGTSSELNQAAVNAVRQWVFEPAKAKGKPVAVYIVIPVKFTLK